MPATSNFALTGTYKSIRGNSAAPSGGLTLDFTPSENNAEVVFGTTSSVPAATTVGHFVPRYRTAQLDLAAGEFAFARVAKSGNRVAVTERS